ncbi:NAD-dependent epimerase/dehydratase family protein [Marinomonas sp. THO17]|uniref:NAD-dependent epimerase/dehydratase family protein n=1 Tax=Marinomonas sp. THO17 TaxID=3149048 RepID=UPI00336BF64C
MAKICIAGCGDLGSGVASLLLSDGHQVTGIRRTGTSFPNGVSGITGELRTLPAALLPEADLVFLIMTPSERSEQGYRSAYYETAQAIVERYQNAPQEPIIVFVSSTSVYDQQYELITEQTQAQTNSPTASVLLATEALLAEHFSSVAVRCSGIYGPGRYALLKKVQSEQSWGDNSWTNRVHRDDVVSALYKIAQLALDQQALPEHIIVTDQTPVSMWEVKLWLASLLGAKVKIDANDGFMPKSGKRIQADYLLQQGWQPVYPSYVAGYRELVKAYLQT